MADYFVATRSMEAENNRYGFVSSELDTHVIKNSEWGAVAYLSQSVKGKCTDATTCPYVYINEDYKTYSMNADDIVNKLLASVTLVMGGPSTYCYDYSIEEQFVASTTQNIYGVYDMSGKSDDIVMAFNDISVSESGFNGDNYDGYVSDGVDLPESKYYDFYTNDSFETCTTAICGGHAIDETLGWYSVINSYNFWAYDTSYGDANLIERGSWGGGDSIFNIGRYEDPTDSWLSTRLVITAE